jgi:hypothetical protein
VNTTFKFVPRAAPFIINILKLPVGSLGTQLTRHARGLSLAQFSSLIYFQELLVSLLREVVLNSNSPTLHLRRMTSPLIGSSGEQACIRVSPQKHTAEEVDTSRQLVARGRGGEQRASGAVRRVHTGHARLWSSRQPSIIVHIACYVPTAKIREWSRK